MGERFFHFISSDLICSLVDSLVDGPPSRLNDRLPLVVPLDSLKNHSWMLGAAAQNPTSGGVMSNLGILESCSCLYLLLVQKRSCKSFVEQLQVMLPPCKLLVRYLYKLLQGLIAFHLCVSAIAGYAVLGAAFSIQERWDSGCHAELSGNRGHHPLAGSPGCPKSFS